MKTSIRSIFHAGLFGLFAISMTACQSTDTSSTAGTSAVMCDKCQTVWVKRPFTTGPAGKGGHTTYRSVKAMQCPECESALATFFKTGELKHHCNHCGGALTHCTQH